MQIKRLEKNQTSCSNQTNGKLETVSHCLWLLEKEKRKKKNQQRKNRNLIFPYRPHLHIIHMFTSTPSHHDDDNNDVCERAEPPRPPPATARRKEEECKSKSFRQWRYLEHKHFHEEHGIVSLVSQQHQFNPLKNTHTQRSRKRRTELPQPIGETPPLVTKATPKMDQRLHYRTNSQINQSEKVHFLHLH